jgi:hypothetical protein
MRTPISGYVSFAQMGKNIVASHAPQNLHAHGWPIITSQASLKIYVSRERGDNSINIGPLVACVFVLSTNNIWWYVIIRNVCVKCVYVAIIILLYAMYLLLLDMRQYKSRMMHQINVVYYTSCLNKPGSINDLYAVKLTGDLTTKSFKLIKRNRDWINNTLTPRHCPFTARRFAFHVGNASRRICLSSAVGLSRRDQVDRWRMESTHQIHLLFHAHQCPMYAYGMAKIMAMSAMYLNVYYVIA